MSLKNFVDYVGPPLSAEWLNQLDALKFTVFDDAGTKDDARAALTSDAALEIVNGGTGVRDAAGLAALILAVQAAPSQQLISPEYDLDIVSTIKDILLVADRALVVTRVALYYTQTTSSDAGINILVQMDTNSDYGAEATIATVTTEASKPAGQTTEAVLNTTSYTGDTNTIFVTATLNKTGAGKCRVVVDFKYL